MKNKLLQLVVGGIVLMIGTGTSYANSTLVIQPVEFGTSTVASNAVGVPLLAVALTADGSDVSVKSLVVRRTGLSSNTDIESIRATAGTTQSMRTRIQTNDQATITFRDGVVIPDGSTVQIVVTATIKDVAQGRTIGLQLLDVYSTAQVKRVLPANAQTVRPQSTQNVPVLEYNNVFDGGEIQVGYTSRVGRFSLTNTSRTDAYLQKLRLTNEGTAPLTTTIGNVQIQTSSNDFVPHSPGVIGRKTIDFFFTGMPNAENGYKIPAGQTVQMMVWADVLLTARRDQTLVLTLDKTEDMTVDVPAYRSANTMRTTNTPQVPQKIIPKTLRTLRSNTIRSVPQSKGYSMSRTASRVLPRSASNPVPGSRDVVFYTGSVRVSGVPVRSETVRVFIDAGSSAGDKDNNGRANEAMDFESAFTEFRLYVDGAYQDETSDIQTEGGRMFIEFNAGDVVFQDVQDIMVTGRVSNDAVSGDRVKLSITKQESFPDQEFIR